MKSIIINLIFTMLFCSSFAQDANFSQTFNNAVFLNPANTGKFDKDWRLSGGYRNTFFGGNRSFSTGLFAIEKRLDKNEANAGDRSGIALMGMFDESNGGALKSNYIGFSAAYNKSLDAASENMLGVGMQGVWASRSLYVNRLVFEDQFSSGGFMPSIPSSDAFRGGNYSYFDVNAGINFSHNSENGGFGIGYAVNHVTRPVEQFWGNDYKVPLRHSLQASGRIRINPVGDEFNLVVIHNNQDQYKETIAGGYFSKVASNDVKVNVGVYHRIQNAIIPMLGLSVKNFKAFVTYDANINNKLSNSVSRRSVELFFSYDFSHR